MAANSGDERPTRLQCVVAILRYMMVTVVTVLAIVVIVKVIVVGARPEDIRLSVVQGHVWTSALWNSSNRGGDNNCGGDDNVGGDMGCPDGLPMTKATFYPVEHLDLWFVLSVHNPSGRGGVHCNNISVSFIDDESTGPMTIATTTLPYKFLVRRQSSHKFYRYVFIRNTTVLAHIANEYGGRTSFTGKMKVTMNTSDKRLGRPADPRTVGFDCWPVEFSIADASATATSLPCTPHP